MSEETKQELTAPPLLAAPCSAAEILVDLIEDPHDNGDYRLNIDGDDLRNLYRAVQKEGAWLARLRQECRHKFIDSKECLKCGWEPPNEKLTDGAAICTKPPYRNE